MNNTHAIDAETVHNWRARYAGLPYFADLSPAARAAMDRAHDRQYDPGTTCHAEGVKLAETHPDEFTYK